MAVKTLYRQVVDVSIEYLGPTAERFVARQITTHLRKDPGKLHKRDIPKLTKWISITFSLLTDDQDLVDSYAQDLQGLAVSASKSTRVTDAQSK